MSTKPHYSIFNFVLFLLLVIPSEYNIFYKGLDYLAQRPDVHDSFAGMMPFLKLGITIVLALIFLPAILRPLFPTTD